VTAILLQVALDITKERDIAYGSDYEQEKGSSKDEDGEESRDCECSRDEIVPYEVLLEVEPRRRVDILFRQIDCIQSQGVDNLTRSVSEK